MPCLHEKDLSALAQHHVQAQRANIQNQRHRLTQITSELRQLKDDPATDPLRVAEAENAVTDLEFHLNGRVRRSTLEEEATSLKKSGLKPDRLKRVEETLAKSSALLLKDPDLDMAEERAKMMEALYIQRQHFQFEDNAHDKDKEGNPIPRHASVFGAPTVKKLKEAGEHEIAEDLMLRSISRDSSR